MEYEADGMKYKFKPVNFPKKPWWKFCFCKQTSDSNINQSIHYADIRHYQCVKCGHWWVR